MRQVSHGLEKLETEYQEGLRNKEIIDRMMEIHMKDVEGHEEWTSSYKPKISKKKISSMICKEEVK